MTAAVPTRDLARDFAAFVTAARRLEASHAELKARAAAIDVQLAQANRALQVTLAEREAILSALPAGVLATAASGELVWCNPEGERLANAVGASGAELARLPAGECESGALTLAVRRVALPGDGELVVVEDRTQVTQLARAVDRLDRLAGLTELALGIAHEIKNPLNGVMGFAALLERTEAPDDLRRYARRIAAGLAQIDGIVREMLAFAHTPRGAAAVALVEIVAEAALAAGVPRRCIDLRGADDVRVEGTALVRVLANLFRNSAEAQAKVPAITVTAHTRGDRLELHIRDDGPGVSAELRQQVFTSFVSTKNRGSGLGLALAARVVSFLGGRLRLLDDDGQPGACFALEVPLTLSAAAVGTSRD